MFKAERTMNKYTTKFDAPQNKSHRLRHSGFPLVIETCGFRGAIPASGSRVVGSASKTPPKARADIKKTPGLCSPPPCLGVLKFLGSPSMRTWKGGRAQRRGSSSRVGI